MNIKDTLETIVKTAPVYVPLTLATLYTGVIWDKMAGNPYYHLAGVISIGLAHTLDDLSSQEVVKELEKKQNKNVIDVSPFIGDEITFQKYSKGMALMSPLIGMIGFISPPTGLTYLAVSPYIVYNNLKIAKKLKGRK